VALLLFSPWLYAGHFRSLSNRVRQPVDRYPAKLSYSTYSRLYLVEKALGKDQAANQNYQKAAEHWRRLDSVEGRAPSTAAQIHQEIESVDAHLAEPAWKKNK